jgi:hypothetical protein
MLYALMSENHGWIHGYLENDEVQYGSDIKIYDEEFDKMNSLANKLATISGEKVYLKTVEVKYLNVYSPKLTFKDIARGNKFYCEDWLYSKISNTQAVCITSDSGVIDLYSGNIYTFSSCDEVKKYG